METLGTRLKNLRKAKKLTQQQLADAIGVSKTSVIYWEKDENVPKHESVVALERILNTTSAHLLYGATQIEDWDSDTPLEPDEVEITFYKDFKLSCGSGALNEALINEKRRLRISRITLDRRGIYRDRVFATTAKDNSMSPEIKDGDTVYVDQSRNYIKDGKVFAIEHGELFRCKRLYNMPNGGVRIVSDNKEEYPEEILTAEQIEQQRFSVIGWIFKIDRLNDW